MRSKVIVFDLDDTLYYQIDYLKSAFKEISEKFSYRLSSSEIYETMFDLYNKKGDAFRFAVENINDNVDKEDLINVYRNHHPDISLAEEVVSVLDFLKKENYIIGIITDGRSVTQRNKIKSLELNRWICDDDIVISEEFGSEKPCVSNYEYFEKKYPGNEFYYIGDNVKKDFIAPKELGWKSFCLIDRGWNIHSQDIITDPELNPDLFISDMNFIRYINDQY